MAKFESYDPIDAVADDDIIVVKDASSGTTVYATFQQIGDYIDTDQGFVTGPASATDNAVVRFDATTGKLVQNSSFIVDDSGNVTAGAWTATDVAVLHGGTGASTADDARTNLGLAIGTNVQAYDATLQSLSSLGTVADRLAYTTGVDTWAETAFTAFGRSLVDDADASTAQATLGLVIGTNVQAYSANLAAIAALAVTDGNIIVGNGSTWVAESGSTARASLGLAIGTDVQAYSATLAAVAGGTYTGAASITTVGTLTSGAINWTGAITTTGTLSAGATTISSASPYLYLLETDVTSTYNVVGIEQSGGAFRLNTRQAAGTFVATDYQMNRGASGATSHTWYITGSAAYAIDASRNHNFQAGNITTTGTLSAGATTVGGNLTGSTGGSFNIRNAIDTAEVSVYGGSGSNGANVTLFGGSHATTANTGRLRIGTATTVLEWTSTGATVTGTLTLSSASSPRINGSTTLGYLDLYGDSAATEGVRILDSGSLVLGSNLTSSAVQLYATKTYSNASGADYGAFLYYKQSAATSGSLRTETFVEATNTSGTVSSIYGNITRAWANGAGGTVANAYAYYAEIRSANASSVITNAYGLYVAAFTATGTITNRWGIYQAGASENNYLAGSLRIGTTSAVGSEVLTVSGAVNISSTLTTGAPSGGTAAAWKLGTVAAVSPTSPNRTIEVDIAGTIYYLHAKTTND